MKQIFRLFTPLCLIALTALTFVACSEKDDAVEEYANWQQTNDLFFSQLLSQARQRVSAGDATWRVIRKWSLQDSIQVSDDNDIVARVISSGQSTQRPLYNDSVRVMYEARLLPSATYTSGRIIDKTFEGEFNPNTAYAKLIGVNSSSTTDGLSTALQKMNVGDRWQIYVPYNLGYGIENATVNNVLIPAYSTLVYDLTLVATYHAGSDIPDFQARPQLND